MIDQIGRPIIETSRGRIVIADRTGLDRLAAAGYGLVEAEYDRMVGTAFADNVDSSLSSAAPKTSPNVSQR